MPDNERSLNLEQQLQMLDVNIVDVLAHLEALLRESHSIQRELLQLRSAAPPPPVQVPEQVSARLTANAQHMRQEWGMLGDIIGDLTVGLHQLTNAGNMPERRSGHDRRAVV
jgi:hypothetical protein